MAINGTTVNTSARAAVFAVHQEGLQKRILVEPRILRVCQRLFARRCAYRLERAGSVPGRVARIKIRTSRALLQALFNTWMSLPVGTLIFVIRSLSLSPPPGLLRVRSALRHAMR
jgi:hypothetical protein